jgi:thiazole synthase ThiGH ThiG subunit
MNLENDFFEIAGKKFHSRLLVGTGKYKDFQETALAVEASGAEIVTVALRRVNIEKKGEAMLQDFLSPQKYTYLPKKINKLFKYSSTIHTMNENWECLYYTTMDLSQDQCRLIKIEFHHCAGGVIYPKNKAL